MVRGNKDASLTLTLSKSSFIRHLILFYYFPSISFAEKYMYKFHYFKSSLLDLNDFRFKVKRLKFLRYWEVNIVN